MSKRASRRPIYVAGVGAVTPLGVGWTTSLDRLAAGDCAIRRVTRFDVTDFPSTVAATVDRPLEERKDRRMTLTEPAVTEAWGQAQRHLGDPGTLGIFVGAESGRATLSTILAMAGAAGSGDVFDHHAFGEAAPALARRFDASVVSPASVASRLAGDYDATGPVRTLSLACTSGSSAIAEAVRALRLGLCDTAICGGVGADVDPLMLAGFGLLGALSARGASRPFDIRRDGFVVGEGAAFVVLTTHHIPDAVEVAGVGRTLDAYHLTKPAPDGDGAVRAMEAAIDDAGLDAVQYVQAHGTSTVINDRVEAAAIRDVLGSAIDDARVSSVKGAVGHWVAGAGAIGFLCAHAAIQKGLSLPTAGLEQADSECDLPHVLGEAERRDVDASMVNSFAFGGANCSIVLRRST